MLSEAVPIEKLSSFKIAIVSGSDKQLLFPRLCKQHLTIILNMLYQGILTNRELSVQLTSLNQHV
jgi:hypothetical protein